jgi:chaperonin GroES
MIPNIDLSWKDIVDTDNIAELLDSTELGLIGQHCFQMYDKDLGSNGKHFELLDKIAELLEPKTQAKAYPYEGSSNVNIPLIQNACIAFASRAYAILFKDDQVVYGKPLGSDEGLFDIKKLDENGKPTVVMAPGDKEKKAARISAFMSYQLLCEDKNWQEDTDKMLLQYSAYGEMYRKRYFDKFEKRERSRIIHPKNLIINNEARDFDRCRKTEIDALYPWEIQERIMNGFYIDFQYIDDGTGEQHEILEQHTRLDLDGDGYAEPYIVTLHSETKYPVRIIKAFDEDDVIRKNGKVMYIEADNYYTQYIFIPDIKGGIHGIGFGYLLLNLNQNINTTFNQLNDAGRLSNTPAILAGRGIRMKGGKTPVTPGKMLFVDSDGKALRDNIYEIRFPEPSATLYNLVQFLIGYAKELGGVRDALSGELRSDLPANTALAMIEQGMNEFKSIFKRLYRAMSKEYKILYDLNSVYLDEEYYFEYGDNEGFVARKDFDDDDIDVMPVADFSALTNIEKQYKAQKYQELAEKGLISPQYAAKKNLEALQCDDIETAMDFKPSDQELEVQKTALDLEREKTSQKMLDQVNKMREIDIKEKKMPAEIHEMLAGAVQKIADAESKEEGSQLEFYDRFINEMKTQWTDYETGKQNAKQMEMTDVEEQEPGITDQGTTGVPQDNGSVQSLPQVSTRLPQ